MKVLCSISGIEFNCDFFPAQLTARETHHPIFNIPQRQLLPFVRKWAARELTEVDSYLLFLAILKSTDHVQFRSACYADRNTGAIIEASMQELVTTAIKINEVANPAVVFPSFVVTKETRNLQNVHWWIEAWKREWKEFVAGYKSTTELSRINRREVALERLIKNPYKSDEQLAPALADWAIAAGRFPTFTVELAGKRMSCAQFWRDIIIACTYNDARIYRIQQKDIQEVLSHCEEHITVGSIFSHKLFAVLRAGIQKQSNYLGLGDLLSGTPSSTFRFVEDDESIEQINKLSMIETAPDVEPRRVDYASEILYLRAKVKYQMARRAALPTQSTTQTPEQSK